MKILPPIVAKGIRPSKVEIDLRDLTMISQQGVSHTLLISEGTETAKKLRAALRQFLPKPKKS